MLGIPIQSSDVCYTNEANKKDYVQNSGRDNCNRHIVRVFDLIQVSVKHFLRIVGLYNVLLELMSFFHTLCFEFV